LEVFERPPCLGGQQWSMKGRHPKTFTHPDIGYSGVLNDSVAQPAC
jgi:hypothetical protein